MDHPTLPPSAVAETHCATVFFTGDRAYKRKKPVDFGFLDFSTTEKRKEACEREVALNRRLAPDVYLGVAEVSVEGQVCDHLVVMRRMPADRRLATLLGQGVDVTACVREVARTVAVLHAASPTSADRADIAAVATSDAVQGNWSDNTTVLRDFADGAVAADDVERAWSLARRYLDGREALFTRRITDGMARDGHGDLLTQDIFCLDDGPRILDCLEFADRYRFGDVLLDVAFLAMDLEQLGHPELARTFLNAYLAFSGEHHPASLAHHYIAYRAHVRAKVACLRHDQGDPAAGPEARRLLRLVLRHLREGRVVLALVGGLPGTGKSTVARGLSDELGWTLLVADEIRKDLLGLPHDEDAHEAFGEGIYSPASVDRVYTEMLARAERLLQQGESVLLDASWASQHHRDRATQVAHRTISDVVELRCEVPISTARERLRERPPGTGPSDAGPEVLEAMAAAADPWPEATTVSTDASTEEVVASATTAIAGLLAALETATSMARSGS